jgi:phage protein D
MSLATAESRYIPDFRLQINGVEIPAPLRAAITSVRYETGLEGSDRVEVSLVDPGLRWIEDALLEPGGELALAIGYHPNAIKDVFLGEISGLEYSFSTVQTLTVVAHDFMHRLTRGTHDRSFPQLPDTIIAAIIAAESALVPEIDPAGLAQTALFTALASTDDRPRMQIGQSNYDFLRQLAAENGFEMTVEGRRFFFRTYLREQPSPEVALRWGESLVEFAPRLSNVGQILSVALKIWIEELKLQLSAQVSWDGERVGIRVVPALFEEATKTFGVFVTMPELPSDNPVEAIRAALSELRRRLNNRITGSGSTIGDPRIRAGRVIELDGLGKKFSGRNYRVTNAAHTIDGGGYRTSFQVRKEVF